MAVAKKPAAAPKLKIYTSPTCPWCMKLKDYLNAKKIPYQNVDVTSDDKAVEEMVKKSGQLGVPQIEINGKIIVGFDQPVIERELKVLKLL